MIVFQATTPHFPNTVLLEGEQNQSRAVMDVLQIFFYKIKNKQPTFVVKRCTRYYNHDDV